MNCCFFYFFLYLFIILNINLTYADNGIKIKTKEDYEIQATDGKNIYYASDKNNDSLYYSSINIADMQGNPIKQLYNNNKIVKVAGVKNGSYDVSFNAYNTRYFYGIIEIFDENDKLISFIPIQKNKNKATSITGALVDNVKDLYSDIVDGNLLTYKQKSGYSAETKDIKFNVPKNGYFKITSDLKQSGIATVLNITDFVLQTKSIMTSGAKDLESKLDGKENIIDKVDAKKFIELYNKNLFKNKDDFTKDMLSDITKDIVYSPDGIGRIYDNILHTMSNYDFGTTFVESVSGPAISGLESTFIENAGSAGVGLKVIFYSSKAENIILSLKHMTSGIDSGVIIFENK